MVAVRRSELDAGHLTAAGKVESRFSDAPGKFVFEVPAIDLKARNGEVVAGATLEAGRDVGISAVTHEEAQAELG